MYPIEIRQAKKADLDQIAHWIARLNALSAHQCLHCDETYEGVRNGIAALGESPETFFVMAGRGEGLVGVLGCDCSEEDGWLWGPFVEDSDWEAVTSDLFHRLMDVLPNMVRTLHTFTGLANPRSHRFYLAEGFEETKTSHIYTALPPDEQQEPKNLCGEFEAHHRAAVVALHELAFPGTPMTMPEIIARLDDDHKLFVCTNGDEVLGYLYATLNDAPVEGFIEFLAVQPEARGQGSGKRLLSTAMHWFFQVKRMPQAGLCVLDERTNAQALYEQVGFRLSYSGVGAKKQL
ncbi:MAG: GNAT family N-acetyltransferase [Ardenticatenales bacterium]|nr:GNAT family N-acetyltransferase [Ardenticatenales bacterium]